MDKLDITTRILIIRCHVEGQSIRATARTTTVSKNTVNKLLIDAGKSCADNQDKALRHLPVHFAGNAFSKKIENHAHSAALHFMHSNFCRQHESVGGISRAMALASRTGFGIATISCICSMRPLRCPARAVPTRKETQTDPLPKLS